MPNTFHLLFLAAFAVLLGGLLLWSLAKGLRGGGFATLLFVLFGCGLLLHQAYWQIRGGGDVALTQFKRNHDMRSPIREDQRQRRGKLLDRYGNCLAGAPTSGRWGHDAPLGAAAFHVIGYDVKGRGTTGLERVFAARLWGVAPPSGLGELLQTPEPEDVTLTLDARLQRLAYNLLDGRRGAVVVTDPRNGEILALVSSPAPDENDLPQAERNHKNAPMFNRATQGLYPPGSVFKIFSAALVLENGKGGRYLCPPRGWAPGAYTAPIRDTHPQDADALITLEQAFAESSNIWFAKAVKACGWRALDEAMVRCGLHEGMTLAACGQYSFGTKAGVVPELSATPNRVAYIGFGQGDLLLTPVHLAALTATIANDGKYVPLHLEKDCVQPAKRIWATSVAQRVQSLMRLSVTSGTSRGVAIKGLDVCGKTGTAENAGRDHAWFTCFAPAKNPEIAVTVLVENGGFGAATALPIAKKILQTWHASAHP